MANPSLSVKDAENAVKSPKAIVPKGSGSTTPTNEPTSDAPGLRPEPQEDWDASTQSTT